MYLQKVVLSLSELNQEEEILESTKQNKTKKISSSPSQETRLLKYIDFGSKQFYQQQNRHECVHPATGYNVLVQFLALTTPKNNETPDCPSNGHRQLRDLHEA